MSRLAASTAVSGLAASTAVSGLAAAWRWSRANLFGSPLSAVFTLLLAWVAFQAVRGFVDWAFVHAVWSVPGHGAAADTSACRAVGESGACWAIIPEKWRFILFGRYRYDEQWRAAIAVVLFLALFGLTMWRRLWNRALPLVWLGAMALILVLMHGGVPGLPVVPTDLWGGLPVTLILAGFGLAAAFALAVLVALCRRSESLPLLRTLCVVYVEAVRGVPIVSVLFMASVMFPLLLPEGLNVDKLLRAGVAFTLFAAAYMSESIRGALQAIPRGQHEAADALGLGYWHKTMLVVLPQALRLAVPSLVNTFIGIFKDTSLVLIIGILDLLTAAQFSTLEPAWSGFSTEVYLFVGAIYFVFCSTVSRYSRRLEQAAPADRTMEP
jgi:general L-amino acid transport system permease protein